MVEFSDFECRFCVKAQSVVKRLQAHYGDKLRLVFRHMPLRFHRLAKLAAEASMAAAAQGKFWAYHDAVFGLKAKITRADLDRIARSLGLDMKRFRAAMASRKYAAAVRADAAAASILGVDGTPTFFVNGTPISGAKPFSVFKTAIDAKLSEAQTLVSGGVKPADVYQTVLKDALVIER